MSGAFVDGLLAGYGIAIPVGAIAILIVDRSLRGSFGLGFMAGAGAATVDLIYALVAVVAGAAVAEALAPFSSILRLVSAIVLVGLGVFGLWRARQATRASAPTKEAPASLKRSGHWQTYGQFVGLTLLNPLTITYFVALVIGRDAGVKVTPMTGLAFVFGAGLASLSWQTLLAGSGALAKRYLSPLFQVYAGVLGNLIVIGLGLRIFFGLYS
jgi:threonine/homoserine/homoserine lactone efflux protein